jgi:hypothetical protein
VAGAASVGSLRSGAPKPRLSGQVGPTASAALHKLPEPDARPRGGNLHMAASGVDAPQHGAAASALSSPRSRCLPLGDAVLGVGMRRKQVVHALAGQARPPNGLTTRTLDIASTKARSSCWLRDIRIAICR